MSKSCKVAKQKKLGKMRNKIGKRFVKRIKLVSLKKLVNVLIFFFPNSPKHYTYTALPGLFRLFGS